MDFEALYEKMYEELSEPRVKLIESSVKERLRFYNEVVEEYSCRADFAYEQWKERGLNG